MPSNRINRLKSILRRSRKDSGISFGSGWQTPSRNQKISSKKKSACILFSFSGAVLVALFAVAGTLKDPSLDETLCPVGVAPQAHIVMILDLTDGWSEEQHRAFLTEFRRQQDKLRVGELISIYAIEKEDSGKDAKIEKLFSKCRPRDGENADPFTENKERLKERFSEQFMGPLNQAVNSLDPEQTAEKTPILETLLTISLADCFAGAQRKELVLFSNMLENSDTISHYRQGWKDFNQLIEKSFWVLDVKDAFLDAEVTVFHLKDEAYTDEHKQWWKDYFSYAGAKICHWKTL